MSIVHNTLPVAAQGAADYLERAAREDRRPRQRGADERAWDEQGGLRTVISPKPGGEQLKF